MMCGYHSYSAIAEWGRTYPPELAVALRFTHMTQYGITSLTPACGSAERILMLRRGHWAIENLSHRTRDVFFDEDVSQVRCSNIPQVMCALRNATISLLRTSGNTEIAYARRYFAAKPKKALALLGVNIDN